MENTWLCVSTYQRVWCGTNGSRGVETLDPQSRWVPPLGAVGSPDSMGNSIKGDLYTYVHTYLKCLLSLAITDTRSWKNQWKNMAPMMPDQGALSWYCCLQAATNNPKPTRTATTTTSTPFWPLVVPTEVKTHLKMCWPCTYMALIIYVMDHWEKNTSFCTFSGSIPAWDTRKACLTDRMIDCLSVCLSVCLMLCFFDLQLVSLTYRLADWLC